MNRGDRADLDVIYESGVSAQLPFRKEATGWKFDLSHPVAPSLRNLEDTCLFQQAYNVGRTLGQP